MQDTTRLSPNAPVGPDTQREEGDAAMFCTSCGVKNGSDANFCKQCGHKLDKAGRPQISEEEFALPPRPEERVGDLMALAFRSHEAGDMDGAIRACADALEIRPQSTSAHSLMGMLYEEKGDTDKAIAEFEQVLAINPGSIADREKLDQLRNGAGKSGPVKVISSRRPAAAPLFSSPASAGVYAVAVFLFILMVGALAVWARGRNRHIDQARADQVFRTEAPAASPLSQPQIAQNSIQGAQFGVGSGQPYFGNQPANAGPPATYAPRQNEQAAEHRSRVQPGEAMPPAVVAVPAAERLERDPAAITQVRPDPGSTVHLPDVPQTAPQQAAPSQPVRRDPGRIEIVVSSDKTGDAKPIPVPSGGALMGSMDSHSRQASAYQAQIRGDYRTAIREYMKSLDGSADEAGHIHQMIGMCYQRLGENDSAVTQYNDAIVEYRRLVTAGHNVDVANRGIKACQDGIKACQ